ncbi:MAG: squalene/phytoene synthase family protein, partial [Candidatus Methylomirabilales bacterium]
EAAIRAWRKELDRVYEGRPTEAITRTLGSVVRRFRIPKRYFEELIAGVEMDLTRNRYRTFEDLYQYCYRVASVVGLMCIEIFGYTSPRTREYAVSLGIALQLTNILRDLKTDAERGRLYLPQEDLHRFGVPEGDILGGHTTPALLALMRFEAERAGGYFEAADRLLPSQDRPRLYAAEIMGMIYRRTLEEIVARDFPVFTERVSLPGWYKMSLAITIWSVSRVVHHLRRH